MAEVCSTNGGNESGGTVAGASSRRGGVSGVSGTTRSAIGSRFGAAMTASLRWFLLERVQQKWTPVLRPDAL